jgi:hypothetical protein
MGGKVDVPEDGINVHGNAEQENPIRSTHEYLITNHPFRTDHEDNGYINNAGSVVFHSISRQTWPRRSLRTDCRSCSRCTGKCYVVRTRKNGTAFLSLIFTELTNYQQHYDKIFFSSQNFTQTRQYICRNYAWKLIYTAVLGTAGRQFSPNEWSLSFLWTCSVPNLIRIGWKLVFLVHRLSQNSGLLEKLMVDHRRTSMKKLK